MIIFSIVLGKLLARGCEIMPCEEIWTEFLESPEFKHLQSMAADSEKNDGEVACELPHDKVLELWMAALEEACGIWKIAVHDSHAINDDNKEIIYVEDEKALWKAICFLIKGAFYFSNRIPLTALAEETNDQYLLHAAAGILPLCRKRGVDSTKFRIVWKKILLLHGDQAVQEGPVMWRCPLHIAAASKCPSSVLESLERPSLIAPFKDDRELHTEVLGDILAKTPPLVVTDQDSEGNCSFHLAYANGYTWDGGLQALFEAAPEVAKSGRHFVLMASSAKHAKKKSSCGKWLRSKWCNKKKAHRRFIKEEMAHQKELEELSTVFQLLQADPSIALTVLLEKKE